MLMKVLSVRQPWAWCLLHGKPVENRVWPTKYRGPVLIHASKTWDESGYQWIDMNCDDLGVDLPHWSPAGYQRGGIVGKADLIDCVTSNPSPWFFGPYGFVMANPEPLPFHPCKGKLGLFEMEWPPEGYGR